MKILKSRIQSHVDGAHQVPGVLLLHGFGIVHSSSVLLLLTGSSFHLTVFEQSVPFLLHITVLTPYVVEQQLDSLECINIPS